MSSVSEPCESEAVYLFCNSLIHVAAGGVVSTDSPPVDAHGGSFIAVDTPFDQATRQAFAVYRQALRDVPETTAPSVVVWPQKPW
ncbi:phage tail assembly chaperone [Pseudomonas lurida]|uniref:phage tail assembly chaperone n=1 Tax=Pseudomonas lurida TaxID=244566 RepID=UPI003BB63848